MSDPIRVLFVGTDRSPVVDRLGDRIVARQETTAGEGLDRLGIERFDCVISAYDLDGTDGVELLERIRAEYPDLPVILLVSDGTERIASDAISAGVTDYFRTERVRSQTSILVESIEDAVSASRSERELKREKRRLEDLTESTTDCLWMFDSDWEELLFISGYEQVWERPTETIRQQPQTFLEAVHHEDRSTVREAMERLSTGETIDIEYRIHTGNDEMKWVWVKGEPVFDEAGTVVCVGGFTRDITERKRREQQYRTLVENLPGMVYRARIRPGWPFEFVDGECVELTGYAPSELAGETVDENGETVAFGTDVVHPDDREMVFSTITDTVKDGEPFELTYRIKTKAGDLRWVWERGRAVDDDTIEGFITDITARVTRKQQLEVRNRAIAEAPVGITIVDTGENDNPIRYANERFTELTGYDQAEVLGRDCRFLQGPETETEPVATLRTAIENRESTTVELRNYRNDGTMFWNRVSIAPVFEDGEVTHYVGFQEDITDRKQRERQITVLGRVLRHNLRNDQNVIRGWAEVIQENADDEIAAHADRIIRKSDQLIQMAERGRAITGLLTEPPRTLTVQLCPILERMVTVAKRNYPDATISLSCPDNSTISATVRIEEAIEELVTNAIVHNDSETPRVTITVTESETDVTIEIADTGPSIPGMERELLFGAKDETPLSHGSGLGLWLVNLIVTRSGGSIAYEPNEPRGNRISIRLSQ